MLNGLSKDGEAHTRNRKEKKKFFSAKMNYALPNTLSPPICGPSSVDQVKKFRGLM